MEVAAQRQQVEAEQAELKALLARACQLHEEARTEAAALRLQLQGQLQGLEQERRSTLDLLEWVKARRTGGLIARLGWLFFGGPA